MKTRFSNIILGVSALALAGCATAPALKKGEATTGEVKASYSEKIKTRPVSLAHTSVKCPATATQWESQDWRKVTAMANACVKSGDWYKVETLGNFLSVKASLTPWGPFYLALAASSRKDYPRAIWMLELALKKSPNEGLFHYELGRIAWELGDDAQAKQRMKLASDLNPSLTEAHWVLGQIAVDAQDFREAEVRLKKALASDSNHYPSVMSMAALKMKTKDWGAAEDYLNRAIHMNPRSGKARFALAQIQERQLQKVSEAISTYKEIRQLAAARKLDDAPSLNLEQKIKDLEKSLPELAKKAPTAAEREPSTAVRKVSQ